MNDKKIYLGQKIVFIAAIVEIIAVFLPAATVFGTSLNLAMPGGKVGSGVILIVLAALAVLFGVLKKKIIVLIAAALNLVVVLFQYSDLSGVAYAVKIGIGMYLTMIAAALILVGAILMLVQIRKEK